MKLSDNEIIKALERMSEEDPEGFSADTLDLINHLKAKNKELDEKIVIQMGDIDWQAKEINRLKAENEQWKEEANKYQNLWCEAVEDIQTAKSEAYKEFAERFQNELKNFDLSSVGLPDYDRGYKDCLTAVEDLVDSLLAELTDNTFTKVDHNSLCETETYEG